MFSPESSGELNILILPAFGPACEQNHLHPTVLPALDPISGGKNPCGELERPLLRASRRKGFLSMAIEGRAK
jgi:metallophosphoesterase superfamily enzyme